MEFNLHRAQTVGILFTHLLLIHIHGKKPAAVSTGNHQHHQLAVLIH